MIEAGLGLGVALILGCLLPTSLLPSPLIFFLFFIVVFVIAVRYHVLAAYSTGSLAAFCYALLLWHSGSIALNSPHTLIEPFLLLVSGFVTGDLLRMQRQRFEMAQELLRGTDKELQEIKKHQQQALTVNAELERQIALQTTSLITVSDRLAGILAAAENERFQAVTELVQHTLLSDLLDLTFQKYQQYYTLPIVNPTMDTLGFTMAQWMNYKNANVTATITPGVSIKITAQKSTFVPVTGVRSLLSEVYGGQRISYIYLLAGSSVTLPLQ